MSKRASPHQYAGPQRGYANRANEQLGEPGAQMANPYMESAKLYWEQKQKETLAMPKSKSSHLDVTVRLLRRGWTTAMQSASKGGCLSLSQRVGELKRAGVQIADKWVTTGGGARVKAYRIVSATRWTA